MWADFVPTAASSSWAWRGTAAVVIFGTIGLFFLWGIYLRSGADRTDEDRGEDTPK